MGYLMKMGAGEFHALANRAGSDIVEYPKAVIMTYDEAGEPIVLVIDENGRHFRIVMAKREADRSAT